MSSLPRILIIAGSDSSGGAGIQADIKTVSMLGGYAMTAITAITAQNTLGVHAIEPLPEKIIADQIHVGVDDIGADAVKIGMLHNASVIEVVADALEALKVPIVLDPVMVATSGDALLQDDALSILQERLIPASSLITPNVPEAELLLGRSIDTVDEIELAAQVLRERFHVSVLLKGGHLQGDQVTDILVSEQGVQSYHSKRIDSVHTHGTGCTLSSAIATKLGGGSVLGDAVQAARAYVIRAIATAPGYGKGHGPLNHLHPLDAT